MTDRPIIMSAESVRAILDGRKTQTRRVITKPKEIVLEAESRVISIQEALNNHPDFTRVLVCPCGVPGDRLWVRETHGFVYPEEFDVPLKECKIEYRADLPPGNTDYPGQWPADEARGNPDAPKWRPSIHMPRWASRITLEITSMRPERLQEISEADALAEGVEYLFDEHDCNTVAGIIGTNPEDHGYKNYLWHGRIREGITKKQFNSWLYQYSNYQTARESYSSLWESINAKRGFGWDANPWVWVIEFTMLPQLATNGNERGELT